MFKLVTVFCKSVLLFREVDIISCQGDADSTSQLSLLLLRKLLSLSWGETPRWTECVSKIDQRYIFCYASLHTDKSIEVEAEVGCVKAR